ncbi:Crp/Fnr family transcriptional regulator [Namhaeicola litoreus]|uniref:Crp/Fnr family transcriptional regulator n=1 Tax=Namhaeicola litoreus TaxID=1052145 RepID=A0ABW3Y6F5_9FLAO
MVFPQDIENKILALFPYLSKEELDTFLHITSIETFVPKSNIPVYISNSKKAFFILKGSVRGYVIDQKFQERDIILRSEGIFLSDPDMIFGNKKPNITFEALQELQLLIFDFDEFEQLAYENRNILNMYLDILKENLLTTRNRLNDMILLSSEEYYLKLLEANPLFLEQAQKKHVANFLGITPESLSRLIKRLKNS